MAKQDIHGETESADDLTWREQDILILLSERLTNREIADRLHLAESTVKDYVSKIISKLYVKNRREAVERAKDLGLLEEGGKPSAKAQVNLPAERTPFVGRREELTEIQALLGHTRLLSLTGRGDREDSAGSQSSGADSGGFQRRHFFCASGAAAQG